MKLGIMQPYFFPYIGYWQLINAVDQYVIYDDVNYIKRGWINRNKILMNGETTLINLRLHKASQNKLINEVEFMDDKIYDNKQLKKVQNLYKKAPHFEDVFPIIKNVITQDEKNIARYLEFAIRKVCEYLSIDTKLMVSSKIHKNNELRFQDKVIEICKILDADHYINAIGGQVLYSKEDFASQGIRLNFLKTDEIGYKQFRNKFVPSLSIIDVMMFNSVEEIKSMLTKYELV